VGKAALFGAGGAIGASVAAALRAKGLPYRVVGRSRDALENAFGSDELAEIVTWDPDDPDSVRKAAEGVEALYYLVGVPYWSFELHPKLMAATLAGAKAAGVEKCVLVGTVYPYGPPRATPLAEDHPREPNTFKGRMRKAQEDLLLDAEARGDIRGTILRLPDFYGPNVEKSFLDGAFTAAVTGKTAFVLGPIDKPHQFVFTPDVGPVAVALAEDERAFGHTWHFEGSGVITQREFLRRIFAAAGTRPKYIIMNGTMLRVIGVFDKMMRELADMHYLLETPIILDDRALHDLLGNVHETSYDEGIALTLAAKRAALAKA